MNLPEYHDDYTPNDLKYIYLTIFVFFTLIYFLTSSENYFFHTDASYLRYDVAESIVERFDLTVREGFGVKGADARNYSWIGFGSALVSVPFYLIGKIVGSPDVVISLVNPILTALTAVLLFIFVKNLGYTQRASFIVTMFFGLGTIAWPLSKQPFDHPIETFFVLLSFFQCYQFVNNKKVGNIMFSGSAAGMAFLTRSTTILLLPALIVLTLCSYHRKSGDENAKFQLVKTALLFQSAFLPFAGISLWYNHYRFGSIFETGYSLIASQLNINFFSGTSLLTGLTGFLISPGKGFFFYSPVAILFLLSIKSFHKKQRPTAIAFMLFIFSYLLFLSKNIFWHGDWTWGPRYLLAVTPFFIIPIAEIVDSQLWQRKALKFFCYILFSFSVLIQMAAVTVDFTKYFNYLIHTENVKFLHVSGEGVQPIIEPPTEIYFKISHSPIIAQFNFIYEIATSLDRYKHNTINVNHSVYDNLNTNPRLNLFDFWWFYIIFLNDNYLVLLPTSVLLILSLYIAWKLFKEIKK